MVTVEKGDTKPLLIALKTNWSPMWVMNLVGMLGLKLVFRLLVINLQRIGRPAGRLITQSSSALGQMYQPALLLLVQITQRHQYC